MKIKVLNEAGYDEAMLGLSLSYNQPLANMPTVAHKLLSRGGSHIKFLESITVWLDITATRSWWQQEATYRIGITRNSESTEHTLLNRSIVQEDFQHYISARQLQMINDLIMVRDLERAKMQLPEGFLQRRIVCTNYKTLRHIIGQRKKHRGPEWRQFCQTVLSEVRYPGFLKSTTERNKA